MGLKYTDKERILKNIEINESNGCWEWQRAKNRSKRWKNKVYGQVSLPTGRKGIRKELAHRASYMAFNGTIAKGLCVLHKCDNTLCVNPEHLFLGTYTENMQDCISKGRFGGKKGG